VYLAGVWVPDSEVLELADRVEEPTRYELTRAVRAEAVVIHLTVADRERLLRALDDPSTRALRELREVLERELDWRRRGRVDRARLSAASVRARYARPLGIVCGECGCRSETGSGWIALLGQDPDDDATTPEVIAFCPVCAAREFHMTLKLAETYT
jgi:hypothetical protein